MITPCPVCRSERTRLAYALIDCDLHECEACTHLFSRRKPGIEAEAYGDDYYLERHRDYFENPELELFDRTLTRLERYWKPGGNVVDLGSGNGNWLEFLGRRGYRAYGVETSTSAASAAAKRGLEVACVAPREYQPPVRMDGLISWYVVEHVDEIDDFMADAARILPANGLAVFATVDSGSMVYKLGKMLHRLSFGRFRAPLQRICQIHHVQHFSRRSLDWCLSKNGFQVLERFSAPFPAALVNTTALPRLLLRVAYAMAVPFDDHFIQVVIARRSALEKSKEV